MKSAKISLLEEAMNRIRKRFIENSVNGSILMYLFSLPYGSVGGFKKIMAIALSEYKVPVYDNPRVIFSEILEKSLKRLERDGLIEKRSVGYSIMPTGENVAKLLQKIEAYAILEQELKIKNKLLGILTS